MNLAILVLGDDICAFKEAFEFAYACKTTRCVTFKSFSYDRRIRLVWHEQFAVALRLLIVRASRWIKSPIAIAMEARR